MIVSRICRSGYSTNEQSKSMRYMRSGLKLVYTCSGSEPVKMIIRVVYISQIVDEL